MIQQIGTSEAAIFGRALRPERGDLPVSVAKALLAVDLAEVDKERAKALSAKAREGDLTPDERAELERYIRVDHLIGLWRSKARKSLAARDRKRKST
jgi:hypothetical protein